MRSTLRLQSGTLCALALTATLLHCVPRHGELPHGLAPLKPPERNRSEPTKSAEATKATEAPRLAYSRYDDRAPWSLLGEGGPPPEAPAPPRRRPPKNDLALRHLAAQFRAKSGPGILRWIERSGVPAEERLYGLYLLIRLGDVAARDAFIKALPDGPNAGALSSLVEFANAVGRESHYRDGFGFMAMLNCGAFQGWPGARGKLLTMFRWTDAGVRMDAQHGVLAATMVDPSDMIKVAGGLGAEQAILESFDMSPRWPSASSTARILHVSHFTDSNMEALRRKLVAGFLNGAWTESPTQNPCEGLLK